MISQHSLLPSYPRLGVAFFRKVHDADKAQLVEAKRHLVEVLQGRIGGG